MATTLKARGLSRATQVAFGVIIVFLVAQVAWWLWFQNDYIGTVTATTEAAWRDVAAQANALIALDESLLEELLATHPQLLWDGGRIVVDEEQLRAFEADQRGHLRMFRFEGVFFVVVVLTGLWVLARSLLVARELEQRQGNFLLAVTHEFRTPISTLRLLIETLQLRPATPAKLGDYLGRMQRELTRLENSSDKVLASARLEQPVQPEGLLPVDLNAAVREVVAKHRVGLETRGAELRVEYTQTPMFVELEPLAFETALTNLFDNAVKYSTGPLKPVTVGLTRHQDSACVTVSDEGIGVTADEAKRIFERFYRPGSEMTRGSQGVGLGLYLVKSSVEALGGTVHHEPNEEVGRGSHFVVRLPLAGAQAVKEKSRQTSNDGAGPAPSGEAA